MTRRKSSPAVTWPLTRSYSRRSMSSSVLWRRSRARRSATSFSRAGESLLSEEEELGSLGFIGVSVVITLFSHGEGNRKAIAPRRKRARGERCVRAGRIFKMVEVEDEVTGFIEAICGKS